MKRIAYYILFLAWIVLMLWLSSNAAHAQSFFKGPGLVETPTSTATAGATTTLTKDSQTVQRFTGASNQTIVLPNATTLPIGRYFFIANDSSGALTVRDATPATLKTIKAGDSYSFRVVSVGSAAGVWSVETNFSVVNLTSDVTGILPLANGGTNKNMTASAGSVTYSDADSLELSAVGTSGQALISGGTGAPTWFNPTLGSVLFAGTGGILAEDNTNFFWDDTNNRLGVGVGAAENTIIIGGVTYGSTFSVHAEGATDGAESTIHRHSNTAGFGSHLIGARSRGTEASETAVQNNDYLLRIDSAGFDGTDYELAAQIDVQVDGTPGSNDMPGRIVFYTTPDGSATPTEALRLSQNQSATFAGAVSAPSLTLTTTPLAVGSGGTGNTTLTNHGVLLGQAASAIAATSAGTAGQFLTSSGAAADPVWTTNTFPATATAPCSLLANTNNTVTCLAATTGNRLLRTNGTTLAFSQVDLTTDVTGILPIANGGTGTNSFPYTASSTANLGIQTSVSSNAMTIALKQADGTSDATSTNPVSIGFRSSSTSTGAVIFRSVTGSLSVVIPSGATLGIPDATNAWIYVYAIDNSGTVELAVSSVLYDERELQSTTAISSSSDDSGFYSTTARSNVPIRLIRRLKVNETTSGTYASNASDTAPAQLNAFFEPRVNYESVSSSAYNQASPSVNTWYAIANAVTVQVPPGTYEILVSGNALITHATSGAGALLVGQLSTSTSAGSGLIDQRFPLVENYTPGTTYDIGRSKGFTFVTKDVSFTTTTNLYFHILYGNTSGNPTVTNIGFQTLTGNGSDLSLRIIAKRVGP